MVQEKENGKSNRMYNFKGILDAAKHNKSLSVDSVSKLDGEGTSKPPRDEPSSDEVIAGYAAREKQLLDCMLVPSCPLPLCKFLFF